MRNPPGPSSRVLGIGSEWLRPHAARRGRPPRSRSTASNTTVDGAAGCGSNDSTSSACHGQTPVGDRPDEDDASAYVATVEALIDSRRDARVLYEVPQPMRVTELARWYMIFSFGAHACVDCGGMLVSKAEELYCEKCLFQHVKMGVVDVERRCAFCQDLCHAELACSHPVHHRCFRDFSASALDGAEPLDPPTTIDHLKCPICRTRLTHSDLLDFVAASIHDDVGAERYAALFTFTTP